jgi:hypothetical protein
MQLVTKTEMPIEHLAADVAARGRGLFQSKEKRDAVHAIVGGRRSSVRGQQLHPEYVTDYVGSYHTGFGNTDYQTYFSVLYAVDL